MMSAPWQVILFYLLGVLGVTYVISRSALFAPIRIQFGRVLPPLLFAFLYCMYCVSFWVGSLGWFLVSLQFEPATLASFAEAFYLGGPVGMGVVVLVKPPADGAMEHELNLLMDIRAGRGIDERLTDVDDALAALEDPEETATQKKDIH